MPLDPQTREYLDQMAALNMPPLSALQPEVMRQLIAAQVASEPPGEPVARVEDRTIPGPAGEIPVRIYTPEGEGPFPLLVYFHGGGWVICDLDTHDSGCRSLCNGAGCVVVSVDYRLAPEHKFPAAVEDCYAATSWVAEHAAEIDGDAAHLAVGGDSAGGNLTAVVAQLARDQHGPRLFLQLLIYPATNFTAQTPSKKENAEGYFLTVEDMDWFEGHYLNSQEDRLNPLASPLLASDLSNLPPALILTAEYDPLRDEGEQYGQRLQEAGVPVTMRRYDGLIHGFFNSALIIDAARRAVEETSRALRAAFAGG
ncbi:MAG TPA: alpha/beta hydrolase fold domain-containing protein [Ktedonobacteraceae bacterium]